jgi:hypothetical protein
VRLLGLVVSALLGAPVLPVATVDDSESLTVSPSHGVWTAPFTISYTYTFGTFNPMHCARDQVTFNFDQVVIGPVPEVYGNGACVAKVRVNLPGPTDQFDRVHMYAPGPHVIWMGATTTTYTIDPGPPTAKPSPTHAPAPAASRPAPTSPAAAPSVAPTDPAVAPSPSVVLTSDPPSATARALAAAVPAPSRDGSSGGTWIMAGASVLVLGGGGLLGLLVLRRRRQPADPEPDADTLDA